MLPLLLATKLAIFGAAYKNCLFLRECCMQLAVTGFAGDRGGEGHQQLPPQPLHPLSLCFSGTGDLGFPSRAVTSPRHFGVPSVFAVPGDFVCPEAI